METAYTLELTDKQMASITLFSTGYLALVIINEGFDPVTGEKIDLELIISASEVIDIFNQTVGNPPGQLPEIIEALRIIADETT